MAAVITLVAIWFVVFVSATQPNGTNVTVSFNKNKVSIRKNDKVYNATFTQLFRSGFIHHDFKNDDKAKSTLVNHQNDLAFKSHEYNDNTIITYILDYFDIIISIPNHLFDLDLERCTDAEQLIWYKNKYKEYVQILTLNDYVLEKINLYQLEDSNFMFKFYPPDEIVYDHQGFTIPQVTYTANQYHYVHHKITKDEYRLVMLKWFYDQIKRSYGIQFQKFDNVELELSTFLSENKINVTTTKYYKKIGKHIYFIKNNMNPNLLLVVYHDRVNVENLDLLYWELKWITCSKEISSYFIDLIPSLTQDYVITKLPTSKHLIDKVFQSDIFVINVEGKYYSAITNGKYVSTSTSFVVSLLYKMIIKHQTLSLMYVGAVQYYGSGGTVVYQKYDKNENIPIKFDETSKQTKTRSIQQYQNLATYALVWTESINEQKTTPKHRTRTEDIYKYSFSLQPNFPVKSVLLYEV